MQRNLLNFKILRDKKLVYFTFFRKIYQKTKKFRVLIRVFYEKYRYLRTVGEIRKLVNSVFKDVVPTMAAACMKMKNKFGINLEGEECALTRLYILFMFRIQL